MEQSKIAQQQELNTLLNQYRHEYYNLNAPTVSDEVYDRLFDKLRELEQATGVQMANSPTQTVGWPAVSKLEKTIHIVPLLSLDKTKSSAELVSFMGSQLIMLMLKLDGLTVKLTYEGGVLAEAATRGDGNEGEIITHNVRGITGIPTQIPYKSRLVVTGEAFIRPSDFEALKAALLDSTGKPYKNGRNLAAGSVRLLDAADCRARRVTFMPFNVLEGFPEKERKSDKLYYLPSLGFDLCKFMVANRPLKQEEIDDGIQRLKKFAEDNDIPIDGIVMTYNDIAYSKTCGRTGHHYKDGLAFKFEDDLFETRLQQIEWTPSRTGEIAPVAVFEPVEIDGCTVSRASLHNLSFIEGLELMLGNRVLVSKRNMIIPHVEENLDRGGFCMEQAIPNQCPCCGQPTRIHENNDTKTLFCDNPACETRRLRKFVHFVSQKAMDIEGLSEATLERLIGRGWIHSPMDIYQLNEHQADIVQMEGFGEKSWQRLWEAIQRSRETTFERYLIAMDIPMIGNTASRTLAQQFHSSLEEFEEAVCSSFDFTQLPDFGEMLHQNIYQWFQEEQNWDIWLVLRELVHIAPPAVPETAAMTDNPFAGKTVVVTGKVEPYTRGEINAKIETLGAHAGSSVSSKTHYLVCVENAGSKLERARSLGVTVLTPAQFFEMAGV
jgi:DNA ligase (NAD+)